jgi:hypothetical protein
MPIAPTTHDAPGAEAIAQRYDERAQRFARAADREAATSARFSRARLALVLTLIGAGVFALSRGALATPTLVVVVASLTALVVLVVRHERVEQRRDAANTLARINREAAARLRRHWNDLPDAWTTSGLDDHPYALDLDLFGHASLIQILGPVRTPAGRATVCRWLLAADRIAPDEIAIRQESVRELAPLLDLRQQLTGLSRQIASPATVDATAWRAAPDAERAAAAPDPAIGDAALSDREVSHFVDWAEAPSWLFGRPWVSWLALALGILTTSLLLVSALEWWSNSLWLVSATAGWVLRWFVHERLEAAYHGATGERGLRGFTALIALVAGSRFEGRALRAAQAALHGRSGHAHVALRRLEQLVALSDVRLVAWLYLPLQTLTLWELHVWLLIERWRRAHGGDVRFWLAAIGHVEALSALASLAHDHPEWTFPQLTPRAPHIDARDLGHPLLADRVRVTNDLRVGPRGRFLLITGSNMSGKSTLLRAVGLNVVLAQAGGPVCASRFTAPLVSLHTSMRVADSLEQGLSLFMASLTRLQRVVRAAREATPERPVCYLLDEVLQGTNSAERQIAVRTIVNHLLACHAIGAATTHDLELAADPSFTASADSFHLQETLTGDGDRVTMTFDYRLRPGPAAAGNALQLLRMLGLGEQPLPATRDD